MIDTLKLMGVMLNPDPEPTFDVAKCSNCGWNGPVGDCETDTEGDWESGYYEIHLCPKCEDGGCVDDYDFTESQHAKWEEWCKRNKKYNYPS